MCRLFLWICLSPGMALLPAVSAFGQLSDPPQTDASPMELPDEPFLVFVAHDDAYLRCGPAGEHYRTDPLRHGQELEVYVSTDDGWLGVRPVEDSFCWVHSDAIEVDPSSVRSDREDRLGVVVEDKTVAWIGTNLGRARRYRWQVQLAEGEEVVIIGTAQRDGPDGPQTWFRIVPPSGEFRWIHQDQIAYTAEELLQEIKQANATTEATEFLPGGPSTSLEEGLVQSPRPRTISQIRGVDDQNASQVLASDPAANDEGFKPITERISQSIASLMRSGSKDDSDGLISRSSRRIAELIPIPNRSFNLTSPLALQTAPEPTGLSYLDQRVGSGLTEDSTRITQATDSRDNELGQTASQDSQISPTQDAMASTMEITSRPRLITPSSPGPISLNVGREGSHVAANTIAPVQHLDQIAQPTTSEPKIRNIPQGVIEHIKQQASAADEQGLRVLFNRLVAKGASEPEVAVIAAAAQSLNATTLSDRAIEYMSLARRRDGQITITPSPFGAVPQASPNIPSAREAVAPSESTERAVRNPPIALGSMEHAGQTLNATVDTDVKTSIIETPLPTHSGVLVEVYSSDPNRPPFALTDEGGRTLAYVTPAPGIQLQGMLGGRVEMSGETGFLRGVETPHILATTIQPWTRK